MKRFNIIILLAMAIATSCSKEDSLAVEQSSVEPKKFSVSTNLDAVTKSTNFNTTDSFYLYIDQTGVAYDYFVMMKYDGGAWIAYNPDGTSTFDETMYFADDYDDILFAALYCGDKILTLDEFKSSETEYSVDGVDYLYTNQDSSTSTITDDADNAKLTLEFDHMLSRLNLTIDVADGSYDVSNVELYYPLDSFTWQGSTNSDIAVTGDVGRMSCASESGGVYSIILAPQSLDKGFFIYVTFDQSEEVVSLYYSNSLTLEGGSSYSITTNEVGSYDDGASGGGDDGSCSNEGFEIESGEWESPDV